MSIVGKIFVKERRFILYDGYKLVVNVGGGNRRSTLRDGD